MCDTEKKLYHLKYISDLHFATWEELECLSKAIGFPDETLVHSSRKYCKCEETGVGLEELKEMVKNNEFQESVGYTYNNHSFDWNAGLITMGFRSVSHKFITFDELRQVRLAFTLYEEEDGHGLLCNVHTILKTLKTCGRTISPMKLKYRLYHIASILRVKNRLQIAEFLEIVAWCHLFEQCECQIKYLSTSNDKTKRNLYQLNDFMVILKSKEVRIHEMLDQKFLMDYWHLLQEKHSTKKSFLEHPLLSYIRVAQTEKNKALYAPMRNAIAESQFSHRLGRPQTASVILQKMKEGQMRVNTPQKKLTLHDKFQLAFDNGKQLTANEMLSPYQKVIYPSMSRETQTDFQSTKVIKRPKTAPCVTLEEREIIEEKKVALKFDIDMLPRRYEDYVVNDLEYIKPGFWTRKSKRAQPVPEPLPSPEKKHDKRPSDEFLKRISSPPNRIQSPCHGRTCNYNQDCNSISRQFEARKLKVRVLSGDKSIRFSARVRQSKQTVNSVDGDEICEEDINPLYSLLDKTLKSRKTPLLVVSGSEGFNLAEQ